MEYTLSYAKAHLSELLDKVERGNEIFIRRNGKTVAKLVSFQQVRPNRKLGQWKGKVKISRDFDVLPPDLLRAFTGES